MLLVNTGVQMDVESPVDIARLKGLGWKELAANPPVEKPILSAEGSDELAPEPEKKTKKAVKP
jgi:hypothetical protein